MPIARYHYALVVACLFTMYTYVSSGSTDLVTTLCSFLLIIG